jgi:hypothetical protein
VPHRPESCVLHQSTSQQKDIRLDHHKPKYSVKTTFPTLSDRDIGSRNCQPDNAPDQNPSEAPKNEDVDGSKNEPDVLNNSTECPARAVNTVEDPNKLSESISDAIDPDDQPDDQSDLIIDLGPEAGDPINFHPVTAPTMSPAVSCS